MGGFLHDIGLGPAQGDSGSYVNSGPAKTQTASEDARIQAANDARTLAGQQQQAQVLQNQQNAHQRAQGYLSGMMPTGHSGAFNPAHPVQLPPPPPPGWAFSPGQGPVWQTPQRTSNHQATNPTDANWQMTTQSTPWTGGNRF